MLIWPIRPLLGPYLNLQPTDNLSTKNFIRTKKMGKGRRKKDLLKKSNRSTFTNLHPTKMLFIFPHKILVLSTNSNLNNIVRSKRKRSIRQSRILRYRHHLSTIQKPYFSRVNSNNFWIEILCLRPKRLLRRLKLKKGLLRLRKKVKKNRRRLRRHWKIIEVEIVWCWVMILLLNSVLDNLQFMKLLQRNYLKNLL